MPTVKLVVTTTQRLAPRVSDALFAAGAQGLEERAGPSVTLIAYAERRAELEAIWSRAKQALPGAVQASARYEVDAQEAWKTAWTEQLRPVALTRRLILAPTTAPAPPLSRNQQLIVYRPALAFGDGDHATTRLAARAVEAHYRALPGGALLDIGAGTGVLSFVALASGARRAVGTELDPRALQAARLNARLNSLERRARFVPPGARLGGAFDLAVINIELRPLLRVLAELPAAARRAPRLLVTGFLESQSTEVADAMKLAGFRPRRLAREGEWLLYEGRRR